MLEINADQAERQHPLSTYTQVAWELMTATGEDVKLTYRGLTVVLHFTGIPQIDGNAGSEAFNEWHAVAPGYFRERTP